MQITQFLLTSLFAASAVFAAPAPADDSVSMMAAAPNWTMRNVKRVCNDAKTECTWTFGIQVGSNTPTHCTYIVEAPHAPRANGGPSDCGVFTITSGWSGQFGPGNGFTTLSVVNNKTRRIVWPAYTDKQLAGGQVVKPDQSYTPTNLPS